MYIASEHQTSSDVPRPLGLHVEGDVCQLSSKPECWIYAVFCKFLYSLLLQQLARQVLFIWPKGAIELAIKRLQHHHSRINPKDLDQSSLSPEPVDEVVLWQRALGMRESFFQNALGALKAKDPKRTMNLNQTSRKELDTILKFKEFKCLHSSYKMECGQFCAQLRALMRALTDEIKSTSMSPQPWNHPRLYDGICLSLYHEKSGHTAQSSLMKAGLEQNHDRERVGLFVSLNEFVVKHSYFYWLFVTDGSILHKTKNSQLRLAKQPQLV